MSTEEEKLENAIKNVELFLKDRREPREIFELLQDTIGNDDLLRSTFSDMYNESNSTFQKLHRYFFTSPNKVLLDKARERIEDIISYYGSKTYDNPKQNFRNTLIVLLLEEYKKKALGDEQPIDTEMMERLKKIIFEIEKDDEKLNMEEIDRINMTVLAKGLKEDVLFEFQSLLEDPEQITDIEDDIEASGISSTSVSRHNSANYVPDEELDQEQQFQYVDKDTQEPVSAEQASMRADSLLQLTRQDSSNYRALPIQFTPQEPLGSIENKEQLYLKILQILSENTTPLEMRQTLVRRPEDNTEKTENFKKSVNTLIEKLSHYSPEVISNIKQILEKEIRELTNPDNPRQSMVANAGDDVEDEVIIRISLSLIELIEHMRSKGGKSRKNKTRKYKTKNNKTKNKKNIKKYSKKSKRSKKVKTHKK